MVSVRACRNSNIYIALIFQYNDCVGSRCYKIIIGIFWIKFQYNDCVGSRYSSFKFHPLCFNFNTTIVSVRVCIFTWFIFKFTISIQRLCRFEPSKTLRITGNYKFQYNDCVGSRQSRQWQYYYFNGISIQRLCRFEK